MRFSPPLWAMARLVRRRIGDCRAMMPDDNAPTVPNRPALSPSQPNVPGTPSPVGRAGSNQPVWQIPRASGPTNASGAKFGGFGLGFAIALVVLAAMVLVLVVALNLNNGKSGALGVVPPATATVTPTQSPPQPTATPFAAITKDAATGIVTQFYTNINSGSFQNAYTMLGKNLQASQNFGQFKQQWQGTSSLIVDTAAITFNTLGDGTVTEQYAYSWAQTTNGTTTSSQNQATVTIGYEQGNLHILALSVMSVQDTPTPSATATPTATPTDTPTPTASPTDTPTPTASVTPGP